MNVIRGMRETFQEKCQRGYKYNFDARYDTKGMIQKSEIFNTTIHDSYLGIG